MGLRITKKLEDGSKSVEQLIIELGILEPKDLSEAKLRATNSGQPLEKILLEGGYATELDMARVFAKQFRLSVVDLAKELSTPEAIAKLSAKIAAKHRAIPISLENGVLQVALADPGEIPALEKLSVVIDARLDFKFAPLSQIVQALKRYYSLEAETVAPVVSAGSRSEGAQTQSPLILRIPDPGKVSIESIINQIIENAVQSRVSDIHLEPDGSISRVRCRIDGILHEVGTFNISMHPQLISRLKVISGLDIAEKRNAQDGSFQHQTSSRIVDLRLSTLPTIRGEKAVIRILDKTALKVSLEELGMTTPMLQTTKRLMDTPHGLILVTGPTGSGKTTSVYSMLNHLNSIERNIITIEDPVEFQFSVINQVQVNARAGLTFASVLRNILRQDPDVIMVGEIRDKETADLAIRAALTGHLVVSTIHTNEAVSTVTRLIDMGIEPFMVSSALTAVLSQRLVRTLCPKCRKPRRLNPGELTTLCPAFGTISDGTIYSPVGCEACHGFGYRGRQAIFELLVPTPQLRKAIATNASPDSLIQILETSGFKNMRSDGAGRVLNGETALDEVLRVTV